MRRTNFFFFFFSPSKQNQNQNFSANKMKRIWRRIFRSNEVEFQILKSASSVEIGSTGTGKPRRSRSRQFPRFYSQHEKLNNETNPSADDFEFVAGSLEKGLPVAPFIVFVFCNDVPPAADDSPTSLTSLETCCPPTTAKKADSVVLQLATKLKENENFASGLMLQAATANDAYKTCMYFVYKCSTPSQQLFMKPIKQMIQKESRQSNAAIVGGIYKELGSIVAKDFTAADQCSPVGQSEGFIVIGFKILNTESHATSMDLEGNWIAWTGAREILFLSNPKWELKRMTFHKNLNLNSDGFAYVLLCEYGRLMDQKYSLFACQFSERLRLRHCGSTNLYRIECFIEDAPCKSCDEKDNGF